jgi:glycosidase
VAGWAIVRRSAERSEPAADLPWWHDAVFYQVYVRSFADSDGDGVGDLAGVRSRLGYLELLGVDALRLAADPRDLAGFDTLVSEAQAHGIRVTIDPDLDGGPGELNVRLADAPFDADAIRQAIDDSLAAGASTWTLSHQDAIRQVTRYGGEATGTQRARAMALVELALPGVVYLYNGEELALPDGEPPDGCRVPLPWEGTEPPFGFSPTGASWLPVPPDWATLTVEAQLEDPDSTLCLYRQAIELRRKHEAFSGGTVEWYGGPAGCFAYRRKGGGLICVLNTSSAPVPLPAGEPLLASGPLGSDALPPDTAAWLV